MFKVMTISLADNIVSDIYYTQIFCQQVCSEQILFNFPSFLQSDELFGISYSGG